MSFTRSFLGQVYKGCDGRCYYCGRDVDPFEHWEPDHLIPRAQGGDDSLGNLVLACRRCNRSKGARTVDDYRDALTGRIWRVIDKAEELFRALPRFGQNDELDKLADHLLNASGYSSVAFVVFYGEAYPLPRDEYAPLRVKTLDASALDQIGELELTLFEESYLRLKYTGSVGQPQPNEEDGVM